VSPIPADHALAKWKPGIHAAVGRQAASVISIYDVIGQDPWTGEGVTSKRVAGALRAIGSSDVTVNINSPGGDFFEGIAIYSLLREHPHNVTVKVMGLAASAASIIAMAGDKIEISDIGFLMIHNAWALAVGNRHDMREAADTLEPFDDAMAGLYAARAGVDKAEAAAWMDKETWFNGNQAIEAGIADALLPSTELEITTTLARRPLRLCVESMPP
jgi:ATP-dependent Clp protease protease subunit